MIKLLYTVGLHISKQLRTHSYKPLTCEIITLLLLFLNLSTLQTSTLNILEMPFSHTTN